MSETQGYKIPNTFTLPMGAAQLVRDLFTQRLKTVEAVVNDPESKRVFTRCELSAMAFECLMLAKMLKQMPEAHPEVEYA